MAVSRIKWTNQNLSDVTFNWLVIVIYKKSLHIPVIYPSVLFDLFSWKTSYEDSYLIFTMLENIIKKRFMHDILFYG